MFKPYKGRRVDVGQKVKVYRNLHRKTYSIADAASGLVLGYADRITLQDAEFKVGQAGRQRVLQEQRKNVHAYVVGTLIYAAGEGLSRKVRYNPYHYPTFVNDASMPVYTASLVTLAEDGVTYEV